MADIVWISTTGDGSAGASWSGGSVPGDGDTAVFNGTSQIPWSSGLTLAEHPSLVVMPRNRAQIGHPGSGVHFGGGPNIGRHVLRGDADIYIDDFDVYVGHVFIDMGLGTATLGQDSTQACYCARIFVKGGRVILGPGACGVSGDDTRTGMYVDGNRANVTIEALVASGYTWEHVKMYDGYAECKRDFSNSDDEFIQFGGEWDMTGLFQNLMYVVQSGGLLRYHPSSDPSSDQPYWFVDGTLDVQESAYTIPGSLSIIGRRGEVIGGAFDTSGSWADYNLRDEIP